jgi:hypothetical protein
MIWRIDLLVLLRREDIADCGGVGTSGANRSEKIILRVDLKLLLNLIK